MAYQYGGNIAKLLISCNHEKEKCNDEPCKMDNCVRKIEQDMYIEMARINRALLDAEEKIELKKQYDRHIK